MSNYFMKIHKKKSDGTYEQEIRAKTIDEFVKRLHKIGEHREFDFEDIFRLADQMKGWSGMSKAILVMDMPKVCADCRFCNSDESECYALDAYSPSFVNILDKPDWCPLRELPQKKNVNKALTWEHKNNREGYNACIDEIVRKGGVE